MMRKIFYDPRHNDMIMGMSDGETCMEFPYVETNTNYHSLKNLEIITKNGKKYLNVKEGLLKNVK